MIPRIIHQTAKSLVLPESWLRYQKTVQDLHPAWEYHIWTDEDNDSFVRAEYPEFLRIFRSLPENIMRADVIRYLLLYRLGGVYLDLDYEMLKPFDLTEWPCVLPLETHGDYGPQSRVGNAFMASSPGHPFFRAVIERLQTDPPLDEGSDVLLTTGPAFLSEVLRSRLDLIDGIYLAPKPLFSPTTPRSRKAYNAITSDSRVYGVHHCDGTWRDFNRFDRAKQRLRLRAGREFLRTK